MKLGIDISIGEDSRPQRKLILKILKKFEENNKFLNKYEKEAVKKLGLKKPVATDRTKFKTYDQFLIADGEYRLAIVSYVVYKLCNSKEGES